MAPKLLTDCPENLREAIDWLVQVRHCGGVSTVSDALVTLFDNVAQDAEKSLPSLPDPDRPSARDVVSKLRAFQSTLPKNAENPHKNIIHNLCTSAGSLLGYRYPGIYDGSGIVYGNASRLCDAILSFLYAVFSDVYGSQPYVAGRDGLHNDVIVELKSQLWRGHKGFCHVIPKVATGLQRYNAAVKASNDRVKEPIETVLNYVNPGGELCNGIKALQVGDVTGHPDVEDPKVSTAVSLVERCKEVARAFSKSLTAATNAIDDLNPKLRRKLENARRSFFNHVDWLSRWSKKGEKRRMEQMIQKVKSRLKRLAKAVKDRIKREVHTVVELLKDRVREIRMKLEGITASLEKYVKELGQWMDDAKKFINDVKKYVNRIMQQLDGKHRKAIDQAAADIDSELGKKVEELNQWITEAETAVNVAKEKADEVHKRLDRNSSTTVGKGIEKINEAKDNVSNVNDELQNRIAELRTWSDAARSVLNTAVDKASEVHKQLDPEKGKSTLGNQIDAIDTARQGIVDANKELESQVKSLNKWIETAEDIRHKAETKAREAYNKLNVHEELSENVKRIVKAKNKIDEVNKNVTDQLGSLRQWNAEAKKVLDGAVAKAEEVYNGLEDKVDKKIGEIDANNNLIKNASKSLESEVANLGNWKDAAEKVIKKAEDKCNEILKRVDKNYKGNEGGKKGPEIYVKANELQDHGKKLLKAATEAKQRVEQNVAKALEAVRDMDTDLKKDLKVVKDKIKEGITTVITDSKVGELGDKVKEDLKALRERIEGLKENGKLDGIVSGQFERLKEQKKSLDQQTSQIRQHTGQKLVDNFNVKIKGPVEEKVNNVEEAIAKLYNTIHVADGVSEKHKKKLENIFRHIKEQVGKIKGTKGTEDNTLEGILQHVKRLANAFVQGSSSGVAVRVEGWIGSILGINRNTGGKQIKGMEAVTSWIKEYGSKVGRAEDVLKDDVKKQIKEKLGSQITSAQANIKQQDVSSVIVHNLTKVKAACDKFVEELDKELTNTQIDSVVDPIVQQIQSSLGSGRSGVNDKDLKTAIRAALIALCSCVRQIAIEIEVVGIKMFGEKIDKIKETVDDLNTKLGQATNTGSSRGKTPAQGTAEAVDEAIKGVHAEVGGLQNKFEQEVKKPVVDAINGLEEAVTEYDTKAKQQVTEAAKQAIERAAKVISEDGGSDIDLESKMPRFSSAHKEIKSGLPKDLQGLLDKHIGRDGGSASGGGTVSLKHTLSFGAYRKHIKQNGAEDGKLNQAIRNIKEGVDDTLKMIEPRFKIVSGIHKIDARTFDGPLNRILQKLAEITLLVNANRSASFLHDGDKGVKTLLADLKNALGDGKLDGAEKGLGEIGEAIGKLQKDLLSTKPKAIEQAVKAIMTEVEELKKKLKSQGDPKNGVIDQLTDLKGTGFGRGKWNGKDGLAKIETELKRYNEELGKQPGMIEQAINNIKWEIFRIGFKLQDIFTDNDILDNLRTLGRKLGVGSIKDGNNLLKILTAISGLQKDDFTIKPDQISDAKEAIENELKRLRGVLEGDKDKQDGVIAALNDLRTYGLGSGEWVKVKNKKGLQKIENELNTLLKLLSQQPKQIESGANLITDELEEVRKVLQGTANDNPENRGVMKNLEFMTTHIGGSDKYGLKKIKSDMESLNQSQVPLITQNLNTMSTEITNAAGQLGLNLNQLRDPHIDVKLKGIQDGLDNLRLTDLAAAITMCDDFLHKADEIEKNTIDALWKHVDDEVDDAIKDLTKEARQHYVDSVREALELFAKKVNEDLEQLPGDINQELTMGYKGFMRYLQGPLTSDLTGDEQSVAELSSAFQEVFEQIEKYVKGEITRLHDEQNKEKNNSLPPTVEPYTPKLNDVYDALTALLACLRDYDGGANKLTELVERLTRSLGNLVPSDFKHPSTPLLDTVSRGLSKFAGDFSNTYISAYSGQRCREEHAHKYAKVLLSMVPMTYQGLTKLATKCESEWKHLHITQFTAEDRDNPLGNYLTRCGYRMSSSESEQDGELNHTFAGGGIYELLTTPMNGVDFEMHLDREPITNGINLVTVVAFLYNVLCHYYQACHISVPPDPRYPCTVRDMLSWLSGLQYTQVADKLPEHCKVLLNRQCHDGDVPNKEDPVMAKCIGELPYTIGTTCSHSTALLTAIQGNGHGFDLAAYPYSVDFSNNRAKLHYPADHDALLDMLREIVCRLCKVLYFLYSQCCRSTARIKGWRECAYGRQVPSHHWQCQQIGTYSSTISTTTATTTSSTTTHGCPPTSPLQSFLSDSCHGLLPHTLTAADMVIECANCTANQPGQQCLTPLGFWDLGFAASISGTGWDIAKRLGDMCRDADSCLFVICRTLFLLCPAAPSSLADVFALYAQVLRQWDGHDWGKHRGGTYTDASDLISHLDTDGIDGLFPLWKELHGSYENSKLTNAIASLAGHGHKSHDALSSLFHDSTCKSPSGCAPYLQPLGLHAHHTYLQKHAGLYITWIIYLAWQFWELLYNLLQALDNIDCTASGCATCPCKPGIHGYKDTCHCPSLVQCAGILPTLYRYGFTYRNANLLVTANRTMRCGDLNTQLKEALHSDHFTALFRQIDQLIWHIRMPFLYSFIALWSLVALYLLHTFLYRLDILRIRSHILTTKASHRIDVKVLLTKGGKMLSIYDADYFDDNPSELLNLK